VYNEKTLVDEQRNSPKYLECQSKNEFDKLVHLDGFIAQNFNTTLGHMTVGFTNIYIT